MPLSLHEPELLRTFFHLYSGCLLMRSILELGTWGKQISDAIHYVIMCFGQLDLMGPIMGYGVTGEQMLSKSTR